MEPSRGCSRSPRAQSVTPMPSRGEHRVLKGCRTGRGAQKPTDGGVPGLVGCGGASPPVCILSPPCYGQYSLRSDSSAGFPPPKSHLPAFEPSLGESRPKEVLGIKSSLRTRPAAHRTAWLRGSSRHLGAECQSRHAEIMESQAEADGAAQLTYQKLVGQFRFGKAREDSVWSSQAASGVPAIVDVFLPKYRVRWGAFAQATEETPDSEAWTRVPSRKREESGALCRVSRAPL